MRVIKTIPYSIIPSVFLIACLIPFIDEYYFGLFNEKRVFQVILLVCIFFPFINSVNFKENEKFFLFLTLLIGALSTLLSENSLYAMLGYSHTIMLLGVFSLGYKIKNKTDHLFQTIFFCNIFVVSYSTLNYSFFIFLGAPPNPDGVLYGFYNIRFFNQFQVLSIPFIIYFLSHKKLNRVAKIILILNFFLLLISSARGASIAILITTIIYGCYINKKIVSAIFFSFSVAVILFLIHNFYLSSYHSTEFILRTTSSRRYELWLELIYNLNFKTLLIGNGPGTYMSETYGFSHPHNSVLQILNNWGIIVLSAVIFFISKLIFYSFIFLKGNKCTNEFLPCFISLLSLLIYSFVSGVIVMPIPQTFLFLLVGILTGYLGYNLGGATLKVSNAARFIALLITLLYCAVVLFSYSCSNSKPYGPSFWSNGQLSFIECQHT